MNNINKFTNVALPVVVMAITIALFFMFKPEESTPLFYVNLIFLLFLEVIFFAYFNLSNTKTEDSSTPFLAIFGIFCVYYIVLCFGWMLIYSILLKNIPFMTLKYYIAVLMILTLIWILLSVITAQTAEPSNYYNQKIAMIAARYKKICYEKGLKYDATLAQTSALLIKCDDLIDLMESASEEDAAAMQKKMHCLLDSAATELDSMKNIE